MSLQNWFMLPVAVLISITVMVSGVVDATFFAPIFLPALVLQPEIAIGTGFIIEVFFSIVIFTVPGEIIGAQIGSLGQVRYHSLFLRRGLVCYLSFSRFNIG
jgi:hypothetical protein